MSTNAIYKPSGRAAEYGSYACNFYIGCSNQCSYCYLRRFPLLAGETPTLEKKYRDEADAIQKFSDELVRQKNDVKKRLQKHGIFFSFTSDPMLPQSLSLNSYAMRLALSMDVPVILLTKMCNWTESEQGKMLLQHPFAKKLLAIGLTITGHDEMELKADRNDMRIHTLKTLHGQGFHTFVSIEPIFDFATAVNVAEKCAPHADILKLGLKSGSKQPASSTMEFINRIRNIVKDTDTKVYFKESIRKCIGGESPKGANFVEADWNIFNHNSKILQP